VVKGSKIAQRTYGGIFFLCLRSLLGFILLSEISIKSTYYDILTFGLQTAGLTPLNATLSEDGITRLVFWYNLPNFIPNSKYVVPIDPISCSGSGYNTYFAPGGIEDILLENYTNPEIPLEYYPEADSYLQKDAPGYQIEFDSSVMGLELWRLARTRNQQDESYLPRRDQPALHTQDLRRPASHNYKCNSKCSKPTISDCVSDWVASLQIIGRRLSGIWDPGSSYCGLYKAGQG